MTTRHLRMAAGLVAFAVSATGLVFFAAAARAQVEQAATISRRAYFTRPMTQVVPPVLLNGFPPSTVCLVAGLLGIPQVCSEDVTGLGNTLGLSDGVPVIETPDGEIVQPVQPGTTPVGMLGGQERWTSLLQLVVPRPVSGEQFGTFELVLHQSGLNFALESPAFREAVLAAIGQVSDQNPAAFAAVLQKVLDEETPAFTQTVTGIEACPVTESWKGGDAQNAGLGGSRLPDSDCVLGTTGVYDPKAQTWTFDLTFAAQAWTTGDPDGEVLTNEGIILRPLGAPNLAYGDPDMSTNFQIGLAVDGNDAALKPMIRYSVVPGSVSLDEPAQPLVGSLTPIGSEPVAFFPRAAEEPVTTVTSTGGSPGTTAGSGSGGPLSVRFAEQASSKAKSSWWLILLVPLGLGGLFMFGESLLAFPAAAVRRTGATTRLYQMRSEGRR